MPPPPHTHTQCPPFSPCIPSSRNQEFFAEEAADEVYETESEPEDRPDADFDESVRKSALAFEPSRMDPRPWPLAMAACHPRHCAEVQDTPPPLDFPRAPPQEEEVGDEDEEAEREAREPK